jgi:soluble cytochrome b562
MYNADLLQKSNAMKTEANYRNMQELNKSIIGIQELSNMNKSQSIQEDVIKYQLELQRMQAEDDADFRNYQIEFEKWKIKNDGSAPPRVPQKRTYKPFTINF